MKPRLITFAITTVLVASAPLIAYTINLDGKSDTKLTPDQQKLLSDQSPSIRIDQEKDAIRKAKKEDLKKPTKSIIYLNGQPRNDWPK